MGVFDSESRNMSILMVEKQLLAVSNLNKPNCMSKTDDSSLTQHQSPSQQILAFSPEKNFSSFLGP